MLIQTEKTQEIAALKSGMDEKTARKYLKKGKLPSQCQKENLETLVALIRERVESK